MGRMEASCTSREQSAIVCFYTPVHSSHFSAELWMGINWVLVRSLNSFLLFFFLSAHKECNGQTRKICSWIVWTILCPRVVYTLREHREAYRGIFIYCFKVGDVLFGKIELLVSCDDDKVITNLSLKIHC